MMNSKSKAANAAKVKTGSGLPLAGQPLKVGNGSSVGASAGLQHPSHVKKLQEAKHPGSKGSGQVQHKYANQMSGVATSGIHSVDMTKKNAFEISRNQIGSRGRSIGATQNQNVPAPRRNIQQFQIDQHQQQQAIATGMMVQGFDQQVIPNAASNAAQQQLLMSNAAVNAKNSRNQRANSTMPGRPSAQAPSFAQNGGHQFSFEGQKGTMKNNKFTGSFTTAGSPLGGAQNLANQAGIPASSQSQAIKRIRDSRQRGNKSMTGDNQNQLMQAYINQTVTINQKQQEFQGPGGQIRATEPMRIRAHTDLKKTGIQIGVKIHGIQNSREHLNQTTVLAGNPQNTHLSQGIQQFHSRGNSINGKNLGLGIPGQNQKRSQSVDKNAPHFHQFNQSQQFAQSGHFNGVQTGNQPPGMNQSQQVNSVVNNSAPVGPGKDPKNAHFIHEAIERKIERFSRQRNRGGINLSQGPSTAAAAQVVYNQSLTAQYANGQPGLSGVNSKSNIQQQTNAGQASRAFKAQQKLQQQQNDEIFERQKKKAAGQQQPTTSANSNAQGQMLMRGEIMSAGQANIATRKVLTANQALPQNEANLVEEPTGARNNYMSNMLDGYQQQSKKVQRGGTRGLSTNGNSQYQQSAMQGVPTGPLLASKVVQLPKQQQSRAEAEEQKIFRNGKIKLDRLNKKDQPESPSKSKGGKLTIIEVDRSSPEKHDPHRNKTKIAAAIQMQRQQSEDKKAGTQNPQLQGSQGAQIAQAASNKPARKEKIAVISLTTAKIDVRKQDLKPGEVHSEKQTMEPDEQAQLHSKKRLQHNSPDSPRSQPEEFDAYGNRSGGNKNKRNNNTGGGKYSHRAGSNGSVTVSMRDESIMHMSVNSVTDGNFILHEGDAQSHDSNDHFSIKKQMIRYLSRVADRNKPLFVFNQKLNLGGDSSDDDTGTPSFSLVALIEK